VAHNEEQFRALYEDHYAQVLAFALRRISQPYAQDVVAEAFLVAWRRIESIPAEPLPWLYALARNALANQRRTLRRQDQLKAHMDGVTPHSSAISETMPTASLRPMRLKRRCGVSAAEIRSCST
jgi:DNA-directed RNA polymerase specialized sigma24 family protein